MKDDRTMDIKTIANTLGVSVKDAYELICNSDFPAIKIGKTFHTTRKAFLRWIEQEARKASGK